MRVLYCALSVVWGVALASATVGVTDPARAQSTDNAFQDLNLRIQELHRGGKYSEAVALAESSAVVARERHGEGIEFATAIGWRANLYVSLGRYTEAESLLKRALTIREKALGLEHPDVGNLLDSLASLYLVQYRAPDARPLLERSVAIKEKALGPEHPDVGTSLSKLALTYEMGGPLSESRALHERALAIMEKALGPDHPEVATAVSNLAFVYWHGGTESDVKFEALHKRALMIRENALGPEHPDVAASLHNLAEAYHRQQRYTEAEALYRRALTIREKVLGLEHPDVGTSLDYLGHLYFELGDGVQAASHWFKSSEVAISRSRRGVELLGQVRLGPWVGMTELISYRFENLVIASHRLAEADPSRDPTIGARMFQAAQWAWSTHAATSLSQMAVRQAKGGGVLATLIRERQDLVGEWQARDKMLLAALSEPINKRIALAEQEQQARLSAIDVRIATIDKILSSKFPEYAALTNPEPLTVSQVQALLRDNEVLVLFFEKQEPFIWVVTKTNMRWVRRHLNSHAFRDHLDALRCGLDVSAWEESSRERCIRLLRIQPGQVPSGNDPLPFDLVRAHAVYQELFGQVEDLIKDKDILIVPSGQLTQLPFQVLVTKTSDTGLNIGEQTFRGAHWLAKRHAITVLPAVSSLKALRQHVKPSQATRPFIGFGNPLLDGPQNDVRWGAFHKKRAETARTNQRCPRTALPEIASLSVTPIKPITQRGGLANVADIRALEPLPETADELCLVARELQVSDTDVWLGARATEREVKALSQSGALSSYRIVHFATHGALAGELQKGAEPGLILTPPDEATPEDDGYMTASEIAGLQLDAEWVILSACNTAAGDQSRAEALSGLARAFFYAGARALLVSHWKVYSASTVKLTTRSIAALAGDKSIGRAEALRRAMITLIENGEAHEAHPAYWAPFVVVGEGAK